MQVTDKMNQKNFFPQAYTGAELAIKAAFLPAPGKCWILPYRATHSGKSLPCPSADNTFQDAGDVWEALIVHVQSGSFTNTSPTTPNLLTPWALHSQTSHCQKAVWFQAPETSIWSSWWEGSEATTAIRIARKRFPFSSQAYNNVTKADEISALDKLF